VLCKIANAPKNGELSFQREGLKQQAISFWVLKLKSYVQLDLPKYATVSTCTDTTA
jgi:hypothetical protein